MSHAREHRPSRLTGRFLVALVMIPGLSISGWNFYGYIRSAGAPEWLAAMASAAVDGIGLYAAYKANEFEKDGKSAKFPRLVTYAMVIGSIYINYSRASSAHWPEGVHVLVALPSAGAAAAFEIGMQETRQKKRDESEGKRRSTRRSAKVSWDLWIRHPLLVHKARQAEAADRLREVLAVPVRRGGHVPAQRVVDPGQVREELPDGQRGGADSESPADASRGTEDRATDTASGLADSRRADTAGVVSGADSASRFEGADVRVSGADSPAGHDVRQPVVSGLSGTDTEDNSDDLGRDSGHVISFPGSGTAGATSIPAVVRQVWSDNADTAVLTRIVSEALPDAKPDSIRKAVHRERQRRQKPDGGQGDSPDGGQIGAYL